MLRLLALVVLILNTSAKLFFSETHDEENDIQPQFVNKGDPLWVLTLSGNDWMNPKLRLGNSEELEEFFLYVEPSIRKRRRPAVRVKKDGPERPNSTDDLTQRPINDVKKDFMMMINKFALSPMMESDAYITENTHIYVNTPSLALHFKGPYSVLIVELRNTQWHYFINSRSSLPEWFYELHDPSESPIIIPEAVKKQLFKSLWRFLHVLFGLPV